MTVSKLLLVVGIKFSILPCPKHESKRLVNNLLSKSGPLYINMRDHSLCVNINFARNLNLSTFYLIIVDFMPNFRFFNGYNRATLPLVKSPKMCVKNPTVKPVKNG